MIYFTNQSTISYFSILGLLENVARNKSTAQSSNFAEDKYTSDRAVDGNNSTLLEDSSCTHTNGALVNWWYVDLGRLYVVDLLKITNRADSQGK